MARSLFSETFRSVLTSELILDSILRIRPTRLLTWLEQRTFTKTLIRSDLPPIHKEKIILVTHLIERTLKSCLVRPIIRYSQASAVPAGMSVCPLIRLLLFVGKKCASRLHPIQPTPNLKQLTRLIDRLDLRTILSYVRTSADNASSQY